jgi:hypothetical protein
VGDGWWLVDGDLDLAFALALIAAHLGGRALVGDGRYGGLARRCNWRGLRGLCGLRSGIVSVTGAAIGAAGLGSVPPRDVMSPAAAPATMHAPATAARIALRRRRGAGSAPGSTNGIIARLDGSSSNSPACVGPNVGSGSACGSGVDSITSTSEGSDSWTTGLCKLTSTIV